MNKYEQLIELIINEQEDKARELFHQLVVEKSRDIYESLIDEEDFDENIGGNQVTGLVNDVTADEHGMQEADDEMSMDDDSDIEVAGDDEFGDEFGSEMGGDDMGGEELPVEDRVMDLENELAQLKAEFEQLMAGEEGEEHMDDMGSDMGAEFGDEEETEFPEEGMVREYVEKVAMPNNRSESGNTIGTGGDAPTVNKQSIVAGKNVMGGTAANIVKGGTEQAADGKPTPQPSNQYTKGKGQLPGAGSFQNVPGAKTKGYTNKSTSYEKAPTGKEGQTTDGSLPVTSKSVVGGKIR